MAKCIAEAGKTIMMREEGKYLIYDVIKELNIVTYPELGIPIIIVTIALQV